MIDVEKARGWYTSADPVHDFEHVQRVVRMAERIGAAEGADLEIVRAAAWLHDAEGATPDNDAEAARAEHHLRSAAFAGQVLDAEGWPTVRIAAVQHCVRAHRFRGTEAPATLEAKVLFDADKLDVLGAIGAFRVAAYAALAGEPLTGTPSASFLASYQKAPGEPHTPYHEFLFKLRRVKDRLHTATGRALAEERHAYLAGFFERLLREQDGST